MITAGRSISLPSPSSIGFPKTISRVSPLSSRRNEGRCRDVDAQRTARWNGVADRGASRHASSTNDDKSKVDPDPAQRYGPIRHYWARSGFSSDYFAPYPILNSVMRREFITHLGGAPARARSRGRPPPTFFPNSPLKTRPATCHAARTLWRLHCSPFPDCCRQRRSERNI
jgi:hypothetical protein